VVDVSSGAVMNGVTANSGARLYISSGCSATAVVENGGYVYIEDTTQVAFTPNTFSGLALNGTVATVHSGTTANDITVSGSGGKLQVFSGGFANDATIGSDGKLWIYENGMANGFTVKSGGEADVGAGGWLTGRMTFENGAIVDSVAGAYFDFDLTQTAPGEEALVNNLSVVADAFTFTLTVDGTQADGVYSLAEGAAGFDQTLHVIMPSGTELGTLTANGGTKSIAGVRYTLFQEENELSLMVGDPLPPEPRNNVLVYKDKSPNLSVTGSYGNRLKAAGTEIFLDQIDSIDAGGYHNRVEKAVKGEERDTIDYAKIVLSHGAKLSFRAEATGAAKFTVYSLKQNSKGKYSLKKIQTLKLKDKDGDGVFTADSSKPIQLQVSGAYYVSMEFKDKKAEEAYYNVKLNGEAAGTVFYSQGNNTDDWGDMKARGFGGAVADLGEINGASLPVDGIIIKDEWIGFGDKVDCMRFRLESAAELSFRVTAPDGPLKFTVCALKATTSKKGITTYSQVNVKSVTLKAGKGPVSLDGIRLEAGEDYFLRVDSKDIQQSTGYGVQVTKSLFCTDGDDGWNDVLLNKKAPGDNVKFFFNNQLSAGGGIHLDKAGNDKTGDDAAVFTYGTKQYGNFVGLGDETDYAKLSLKQSADVLFSFTATGDATLEIIQLTEKKGKYSIKTLQTTKLKLGKGEKEGTATANKSVRLEVGDNVTYYVAVTAANAKKAADPRTYYDVSYTVDSKKVSALDLPKSASVADAVTDTYAGPSFGQYAADTSTFGTSAAFDALNMQSEWQDLARLA